MVSRQAQIVGTSAKFVSTLDCRGSERGETDERRLYVVELRDVCSRWDISLHVEKTRTYVVRRASNLFGGLVIGLKPQTPRSAAEAGPWRIFRTISIDEWPRASKSRLFLCHDRPSSGSSIGP